MEAIKISTKAYHLMAEMLAEINPKAHKACIKLFDPPLSDTRFIPFIYDELGKQYDHGPEMHPTTIGVIYKLYAPEKLFDTRSRMIDGIRPVMCEAMLFNNPEVVNYYQNILVSYYKGPRFKEKIDSMAFDILAKIKKQLP